MSVSTGAISLRSSFRIREMRLSGPAAFPGLFLESCFDTPLAVSVMSCMIWGAVFSGKDQSIKMNWRGTNCVNAD